MPALDSLVPVNKSVQSIRDLFADFKLAVSNKPIDHRIAFAQSNDLFGILEGFATNGDAIKQGADFGQGEIITLQRYCIPNEIRLENSA